MDWCKPQRGESKSNRTEAPVQSTELHMILVRDTLPWLDIDYRRKESSLPLKLLWHYFRAPEHKDASTDFGGIS